MTYTVSIDAISIDDRLRELSEAQVEALANSIADVGLLNPITVYRKSIIRGGIDVDGYGLIAGAHRVEACKRLGLADIPAHVVDLGELERQIAECDENLCGTKLTPAEKAMFTKRRKQAYEALHPETRLGENQHTRVRQIGEPSKADRFTAETAERTGQSERVVQRNAERGSRISERALETIRGTALDKGTYLDTLKRIPEADQVNRIRADLNTIAKRAKRADAPLNDDEAVERQVATLMSAWNRAGTDARERFLEMIGER